MAHPVLREDTRVNINVIEMGVGRPRHLERELLFLGPGDNGARVRAKLNINNKIFNIVKQLQVSVKYKINYLPL